MRYKRKAKQKNMILFLGFKFGSVFFSLWEKNYAGAILPFVEYSWVNWSNDNTTHNEITG